MIRIGAFNAAWVDKGRRLIKAFVRSARDVQTSYQVAPWGDDSCPVKGAKLIHAETVADDTVIIGAVNTDQKAQPGEKRLYATDANGVTVGDIWLKSDGTVEFKGAGDNLVRYAPLSAALVNHNTALNSELVKIQAAIVALGGSYAYLTLSLDLSAAKADDLKTS